MRPVGVPRTVTGSLTSFAAASRTRLHGQSLLAIDGYAGFTVLKDVRTMEQGDLMPSYFLAETLKYLYLLFAPEKTLDLKKVVFNTEAHPLRRDPLR